MIEVKDNKTDEEIVKEILQSMREGAEYLKYFFAGSDKNYIKALNIQAVIDNTSFDFN